MFLSMRAKGEQASLVFSGVFCIVWIGEAVVTLQIKLLGGNMYALCPLIHVGSAANAISLQFVFPIGLHHWVHTLPSRYRRSPQCHGPPCRCANTRIPRPNRMVSGSGCEHPWRFGRRKEPGWYCCLPTVRILYCNWMPLLH